MDARPPKSHDVVLVVEDEPFTRLMAADILSSAGFAVLEAGSAGEALTILEANEDVSVVFTDVEMPGTLDGLELARHIGERWPSIGIVLCSGHVSHMARAEGNYRFLPKPYAGPVVVRQIRESALTTLAREERRSGGDRALICRADLSQRHRDEGQQARARPIAGESRIRGRPARR
jgi:two-component system, response regulator PdtaR